VLALGAAAVCVLVVGSYFLGHPFGQFRRVQHLIPVDVRQPLVTLGGLLFDPAGGLMYSAPLIVIALAGLVLLWRLGGDGERGALVGLALSVFFLLPSIEWYGGGAFPARYLAPFLPLFALALMLLLDRRSSARRLVVVALPLGWLVWWVLVTRPQHSVNPGNGGWWLADAISRRFHVDGRALFPSFLVFRPATYGVVVAIIVLGCVVAIVARLAPTGGARTLRGLARNAVTAWLVIGSLGLAYAVVRTDSVVEIESPQVRHEGGRPEPAAGTWSMFRYPNGWWLRSGDGIRVPLHLGAASRIAVEGWFEGAPGEGFTLRARWDASAREQQVLGTVGRGRVWVDAPGPGRHSLHLTLVAPGGGEAMLDRLVVE
jgi:hypothetical protein